MEKLNGTLLAAFSTSLTPGRQATHEVSACDVTLVAFFVHSFINGLFVSS